MRSLAHFLSIVLHPLFMPAYTLAFALWADGYLYLEPRGRMIVLGMVTLMTVLFPITSTLLLIRSGFVSSLRMPDRRERIAPYCMTLLYYGLTWFLLARTPLHPTILALIIGAAAALLITTLITLRWKISAHMVGIGGAVGAVFALGQLHQLPALVPLATVLLFAGALGTARLLTSDHTPAQVYCGFIVGALSVATTVLVQWSPGG